MTIIRTPDPADAPGAIGEIYAEEVASLGYVPSHTRVMATDPDALRAFEALAASIAGGLGRACTSSSRWPRPRRSAPRRASWPTDVAAGRCSTTSSWHGSPATIATQA